VAADPERPAVLKRIPAVAPAHAVSASQQLVLRELAVRAAQLQSQQARFTALREVVFRREERPSLAAKDSAPAESASGGLECLLLCEYLEHDLLGLIQKKVRFSPAQTKYILSKTLAAVAELHEEHLEHQFLKSTPRSTASSIFLNSRGLVQVEGWFNAQLVRQIAGRPTRAYRYQPIEKVLGLPLANPLKSDVWSLGLVFLELVLGESLFSHSRSLKAHVEVLYSLFGPALARFEGPLKSAGLWPAPSFTSKHAKCSVQGYLYKRLHK
jgi:serine/threonine protein kinase